MERIQKSLEGVCDRFDSEKDLEKKEQIVGLMERVAAVHIKVQAQETATAKVAYDHEEADRKIDATMAIEESREIREDRKLELEERKVDVEETSKKLQITEEEKAEIVKGVVGVIGAVSGAAVGILGLKNTRDIFTSITEFDRDDKLPVSTGWDIFRKNFKF